MPRLAPDRRVSVVLAFAIVSVVFVTLSWVSVRVATKMERGLESFTVEYLHSAAEIAARRVDADAARMINSSAADWREVESESGSVGYDEMNAWIDRHPWVISAIWLPDGDPSGSVYVSRQRSSSQSEDGEFYSAGGAVRYKFDRELLLKIARGDALIDVEDTHGEGSRDAEEIRRRSTVEIVTAELTEGRFETSGSGYAVTVPLQPPLEGWAVRASIDDRFSGSGFQNHRFVSISTALIALFLLLLAGSLILKSLTEERNAVRLREALVANVSHELRTPLSMIRLGIETLERGEELSSEQRGDIRDAIHRETMLLSHLVENVLDVARLDAEGVKLVRAPARPADLVRSLLSDYTSWIESKGFRVELDVDDSVGEQNWDREAISRALLNLIDNAVKYSPDQGRIAVKLSQTSDSVRISVKDEGVGLDEAELGRIFDPYYRAKFSDLAMVRGAGLGLTLVREIVRAHGGKMEVRSKKGSGSTFTMMFPRTAGPPVVVDDVPRGKLSPEVDAG